MGFQAHWAAVTGCFEARNLPGGEGEIFYVLARQGKSKLIGIWPLKELAQSNAQLEKLAPFRTSDPMEYKLPEGGMGGPNGLKSQAVLLYPEDLKFEVLKTD